ncbi:heavy-metal-associated domain-containing protein [Uniformispora flossi]|uniref:heavy-metal-associated domain-containing protein n=1 Tax=Uniformispora flossi TaxID=3390723 RepID=UPI003C2DF846
MTTTAPATATYTVTGMTCGHCVGSVKGELGTLPGVTDVAVDLPSGRVTVTADGPIDDAAVAAAVAEAGYRVVPRERTLLPQASGSCCGSGSCG